jgi:hypothetical protein
MDTASCFLQRDSRTKFKTPGAGKNMVGEALQAPTIEMLCKLHYFPAQGSCLVPLFIFFSYFILQLCIIAHISAH